MSEIDDLLAKIKAEYEQKEKTQKPLKNNSIPQQEISKSFSPLDNLLVELKQELKEQPNQHLSKPEIKTAAHNSVSNPADRMLDDLQQEYREQEKAEEQLRQQKIEEEKQHQQLQEKRRRQALEKKAQEWLKSLKPNSDEGLWFEEFSYAYESKLEAAIDYLQAIRDSRFLG